MLILVNFSIRLYFVLHHQGMWGVDGGAYLLSRNYVLGDEPTGTDFLRPPLAPGWLLVPFTAIAGDDLGLKLFSLGASLAILPPFLLLARRFLTPWQLTIGVGLLLFDWSLAEMFTAGTLPVLGFAGIMLAMWATLRLAEPGTSPVNGLGRPEKGCFLSVQGLLGGPGPVWRGRALAAGVLALSIPWIAYTNQTALGIGVLVLPFFILTLLAFSRDRWGIAGRLTLPLLIGTILAATAVPYYLAVAPGSGILRYPGPLIAPYGIHVLWVKVLVGVPIGLFCTWKGSPAVKSLGLALLTLTLLVPWRSFDESLQNIFYRSHYFAMPFLYICGVWTWKVLTMGGKRQRLWLYLKPALVPYSLAMASIFGLGYLYQLHTESKLGRMVTPQTMQAIVHIRLDPEDGSILTNSYSLSLYVAALTKRQAPWTQLQAPPLAYQKQNQSAACILSWTRECDSSRAIQELGVRYVLVETIWPSRADAFVNQIEGSSSLWRLATRHAMFRNGAIGAIAGAPADPWGVTASAPWLELVLEEGTTKLWRTRAAP